MTAIWASQVPPPAPPSCVPYITRLPSALSRTIEIPGLRRSYAPSVVTGAPTPAMTALPAASTATELADGKPASVSRVDHTS